MGAGVIRGFVTGLVWGGVVAVAGLAVLSQLAPLPQGAAPDATVALTEADTPTTETPVTAPEPVATPGAGSGSATTPEPAPDAAAEPAPSATPEASATPVPQPAPAPPLLEGPATPDSPAQPDVASDAATLPSPDAANLPEGTAPSTPLPASPDAAPDATEALPSPPAQEPLLEPAPAPTPATPKIIEPSGSASVLPGDTSRVITPDSEPLVPTPAPSATPALPQIGAAATPEPAPTPATAFDLFARPFDNVEAKPLFAILLRDDGNRDTDRKTLAALPFPVTFVVDPLLPGATEAASIYREAGQEVIMLADAIPQGAKPEDLEQSLQALDLALPDAVAVMGGDALAQDNQQLAAALVPIVGAQGRGLVTMEKGLNALDQVARRDKVPTASVFRKLDAQGETVPVIRRYLDRAAFRAAQEGSVVVMGTTKPDTIAAILQWNVEGRAASVALAPITAVMRQAETE